MDFDQIKVQMEDIAESQIEICDRVLNSYADFNRHENYTVEFARIGRRSIKILWLLSGSVGAYTALINIQAPTNYYAAPSILLAAATSSFIFEEICLRSLDRLFQLNRLCLTGLTERQHQILLERQEDLRRLQLIEPQSNFRRLNCLERRLRCLNEDEEKEEQVEYKKIQYSNYRDEDFIIRASLIYYERIYRGERITLENFMENYRPQSSVHEQIDHLSAILID